MARRPTLATEEAFAQTVDALMLASRVVTAAVAHSLASIDAPITVPQLRVLVMIDGRGPLSPPPTDRGKEPVESVMAERREVRVRVATEVREADRLSLNAGLVAMV